MKGYIYTMYQGADPGRGWIMNDPDIYSATPSLGACVPNVRRNVEVGDYIFVVSGRSSGVRQFVVGGFKVAEKIDALAAFERFPEKRIALHDSGQIVGNVIVDKDGQQNPLDYHGNFERRVENYIVGRDPLAFQSDGEIESSRQGSLPALRNIFDREAAESIFQVIGRWRKMDEAQIEQLLDWIKKIKNGV